MKARFCFAVCVSVVFAALAQAITFYDWQVSTFTIEQLGNFAISSAAADPDRDGAANLHEYAFFGQPLIVDTHLSPVLSQAAGHLVLTYRERHDLSDVSIRLQGSDTLANWITYNSVTEADRETFTGYDEVTLIDPQPFTQARRFLRLRVELLPINEPRAPIQLSLNVVSPSAWTVSWSDVNTTETGHAVERRLPTNEWQRLATLGADTGGWQHTTADYQTSMTYRAVAIGAGGEEAASEPITLPDTDGDGIPDALELGASYGGVYGTYASYSDQFSSNGSGTSDGWLAENGFDPSQPFDGSLDTDGDGLSDAEEARRGTNPRSTDTDNDGVPDAEDGWPRDPKVSPPILPEVRYVVLPLSASGWDSTYTAESVDDAGRVLGRTHGSLEDYSRRVGLWKPSNGFQTLPALNFVMFNDYESQSGDLPWRWTGGNDFKVTRPYSVATLQSKDGWLASPVRVPLDGALETRLYHPDTGIVSVAFRLASEFSSAYQEGHRSIPHAVAAGGKLLLREQGTIITDSVAYNYKSYNGTHLTGEQGLGGTQYWTTLTTTNSPFSETPSGPTYWPTLLNDEGVTLGRRIGQSYVLDDPLGFYSYWTYDSQAQSSNGQILQADYYFLGSGEPAIALGSKNDVGWRAVKTPQGWDEGPLKVWDAQHQQEIDQSLFTVRSSSINRRRELLIRRYGEPFIIRNGVSKPLVDFLPAGWKVSDTKDINNHGVILATAKRTLDEQGQSITNPQAEPVLLVPMEFIAKDMETGKEEPVSDITHDAYLAPTVAFTINNATLNPNGDLKLEVSGTVTDPLSELANDASQRVQQIRFLANGEEITTQALAAGSTHTPWKDHTFSVDYSATLTVPNPGGRNWVIRAETTPNAAGRTGWSQSAVAVSRTPVAGQTGSGEAMPIQFAALPSAATTDSLTLSHAGTSGTLTETTNNLFNGQLNVSGVSRAYSLKIIGSPTFSSSTVDAFQAYMTWTDNSGTPRKMVAKYQETGPSTLSFTINGYLPPKLDYQSTVEGIRPLGASRGGSGELLMWRMEMPDAFVDSGAVQVKVNGQTQELRPFTYSPKKYYIVTPQSPNRPRIFVVTADNLPAGIDTIKPDNLQITGNGDKLSIQVSINGQIIHDASAVVFKEDMGFDPATGDGPPDEITLPVLLTYFKLLYSKPVNGVSGLDLLNYYQAGGNILEVKYLLIGDSDVDYFTRTDGKIAIQIHNGVDPVTGANLLLNALYEAMPFQPFAEQLPLDNPEIFQAARASIGQNARAVGDLATNAYIAGLSIASEPFDWAITLNDLSEGKWSSAVGLIPFVPATAGCVIRQGDNVLASFAPAARNVISEALQKTDRIERLNFLRTKFEAGELTLKQMEALVKGKVIESYSSGYCRKLLAKALGPAPKTLKVPNPHHDLPVAFLPDFLKRGININEAKYGRWVESNLGGGLHQSWSYDFNLEWTNFFLSFPNASRIDIEQFMQTLRSNPKYQ